MQRLADRYAETYGWHVSVHDGASCGDGGEASVCAVAPRVVNGCCKGEPFSQTRWRF